MCGIAGWIGDEPLDPDGLALAIDRTLFHRGPDDGGYDKGPNWGLVFRRLSILDLSPSGHQPMSFGNGRYWIVFNGEIYNYIELRRELEAAGETFVGGSDTEVLLRLLVREREKALERTNGMFALAFLDVHAGTFLIARDRLGQKPLYFRRCGGQLRFASELKALLQWPDAPRELNPRAVVEFLGLSYLSSDTCIFDGYEKLAPGCFLSGSFDNPSAATTRRYWNLEIDPTGDSDSLADEQNEALLELLIDATRLRIRSDVPVGLFLSGGIDSGLVAAFASHLGMSDRITGFTVGFEDPAFDESGLARQVSKHAGLRQEVVPLRPSSLGQLDQVAEVFDEPFADPSALPTLALCAAAADHATVFLAGDGGDEAFAGYMRYVKTARYGTLTRVPPVVSNLARLTAGVLPSTSRHRYQFVKATLPDARMAAAFDQLPEDPIMPTLLAPHLLDQRTAASDVLWGRWALHPNRDDLLSRQQLLDYSLYLPDDILTKVDRASMASSIEVRSPFLDHRVVEFAARLPRSALCTSTEGKKPLRALAENLLPPEISQAPKRGFGVPLDAWFDTDAGVKLVEERLLGSECAISELINPRGVEIILLAHRSSRGRRWGSWLWRLLILDSWARKYLATHVA